MRGAWERPKVAILIYQEQTKSLEMLKLKWISLVMPYHQSYTAKVIPQYWYVSLKHLLCQDGFPETQVKDGFTPSILFYLVQQIQDSEGSVMVQRAGPKRLSD